VQRYISDITQLKYLQYSLHVSILAYNLRIRNQLSHISIVLSSIYDRLCGLVLRDPGYRSRDPGIDSWRYQIFGEVLGLEWGPFSLVSTTEGLLGRNSSSSSLEIRE
jgi:hypothetical protein